MWAPSGQPSAFRISRFDMATFTDNFNRTNESPLSGGGNWVSVVSSGDKGMVLVSNKVRPNDTVGSDFFSVYQWTLAADQYSQFKIVTWSTATEKAGYIGVRWQGTTSANIKGYFAGAFASNIGRIYNCTGYGAYSQLGADISIAVNLNDTFKLQIIGTTLTVNKNGSV